MPENEPGGGGGFTIAGKKISSTTLVIAGAVAILAVLLFRSGGGSSGTALAPGPQGELGPAGPPGPPGDVTDLSSEIASLTDQINAVSEWEKNISFAGYAVQAGDTWDSIAARFGTSAAMLRQLNPRVGKLNAGQAIFVPIPKS